MSPNHFQEAGLIETLRKMASFDCYSDETRAVLQLAAHRLVFLTGLAEDQDREINVLRAEKTLAFSLLEERLEERKEKLEKVFQYNCYVEDYP